MQLLTQMLEMKENSYLEEVVQEWIKEDGLDSVFDECMKLVHEAKKINNTCVI